MIQRMQQRRGLATQWVASNPILAAAELGVEVDTGQFKIGDGVKTWSELSYFQDAAAVEQLIDDLIGLAPETLDTLQELAASINNDPNFFGTISASITAAETNANSYTDSEIQELKDTKQTIISGGTTGQVIEKVSGTDYDISWVTPVRNVDDLSDVSATGPSSSDTLLYNSDTGKWEAGQIDLSSLPGVPDVIGDLSDVTITNVQRDDILVYDGTTWKNGSSDLEVLFWTYA